MRGWILQVRTISRSSILRNGSHSAISEKFRSNMARVSSQAMILTSASNTIKSNDLHGMTLSSVSSLAVYPKPLLEFNLHLPSYTSAAMHNLQYLAIHLLSPTAKSAHLCRVFASGVKTDKKGILNNGKEEDEDGEIFHEMTTPFSRLNKDNDYTMYKINDSISIPILKNSESVFICKAKTNFSVSNHEIWVVDVLEILENDEKILEKGGILYFNRKFHQIGNTIQEN
ncbi:flavin reductase like domain-containing protein [Scheffersomyces amazonensis]|uniref:flavin reductase like domain-containing protein n=1 Tax=Scheffersomyces amazonensis TaxID=1078765 RepID=UPI00315C6A65